MKLWLLLAMLAGCAPDQRAKMRLFLHTIREQPAPPPEALPDTGIYKPFLYTAQDMRDPFVVPKSMLVQVEAKLAPEVNRPDPNREREVLEHMALDTLSMVGYLGVEEEMWAVIQDQQGLLYRVRPGHHMGKHFGKVLRVTQEGLELEETWPSFQGGWEKKRVFLGFKEQGE